MALSANTVWEVRTTGNDTNGGGFVTGASGTDWSQQDTAQYAVTDGVTAGTTTITSATANFGTDVVGNIMYVQGGTGSVAAGWYQIVSRTNATTVVVDRSTGLTAGTGVTLNIGGAFLTLGVLGKSEILGSDGDGNRVWVKSGTYTMTTTTDNVSGGPLLIFGFATGVSIQGYQTTRGDLAARPLISAGSVTGLGNGVIRFGGQRCGTVINMEYDANNGTGNGIGFNTALTYYRCVVRNASTSGSFGFGSGANCFRCAAINCATGFGPGFTSYCIADTCGTGFAGANTGVCNVAIDCTANGFNMQGGRHTNSIAYNCLNGFNQASAATSGSGPCLNCIAYGCGQYGFRSDSAFGLLTINCAAGNNTSGASLNCLEDNPITLTADPFTNAAADDFSTNTAAGGGALLRAAGVAWGDGFTYNQTNYRDVGALQHQDSGGGGGTGISRARGASGF